MAIRHYRLLHDFSDPRRKTKIGIRRKHTSFLRRSDIGQVVTCDELIYHGDAAAAAVSRLARSRLRSGLTLRA